MHSGVSMVQGGLRVRGIIVQRQCIVDALQRVHPLSQILRSKILTYRRQYRVPGPNGLWYVQLNLFIIF